MDLMSLVRKPTVPTTIGNETAGNPFLRADDVDMRRGLRLENAENHVVFGELRNMKDNFTPSRSLL